jgi:hypothetical protein
MGTMRRLVAVGGVAVALLLGTAAAARASFGDPVNCETDPTNPSCVIIIGSPGGSGGGGGSGTSTCKDSFGHVVPCYVPGVGWWGGDGCWYQKSTGIDLGAAEALGGKVSPPAFWYTGSCGDPARNWYPVTTFRVYATDPGLLLLAQEAIKYLNLPAPQIHVNPAAAAPQVVYVPTWLWIDPGAFASKSATASVAGLSVTATATPTKVTWSTGDGARVTCGKGTPWVEGTNPLLASPDCGHTYTTASRSSAGGKYPLRATITWQVTWRGGGATGTEPALTSTSSVQVQVVESVAVNTR